MTSSAYRRLLRRMLPEFSYKKKPADLAGFLELRLETISTGYNMLGPGFVYSCR